MGGKFCEMCRDLGIVTPPDIKLELDHKQPIADGGDNSHSNLRWACSAHNRGRSNRSIKWNKLPKWYRRRK